MTRASLLAVASFILLSGAVQTSCAESRAPKPTERAVPRWHAPGDLPCGKVPGEGPSKGPSRPTENGPLAIEHLGDFRFTAQVGLVKLWDRYLTFRRADQQDVLVCNLSTGEVATVARADRGAEMMLGPAVGSRDTVVYTEITSLSTNDGSDSGADWRIRTVDMRTGARRTVAERSPDAPAQRRLVPQPHVEWPWVAWLQATEAEGAVGGGRGQVWTMDLRSSERRMLVDRDARPVLVGVTGGMVVYDAVTAEDDDPASRDLFIVDPRTGERRRLTTEGGVREFTAANGWVAWQRTPGPDRGPETWVAPVDGSRPAVRLGMIEEAIPGNGFVLADRDANLVAFDLQRVDADPLPLHDKASAWRDRQLLWDADDAIVVWATAEFPFGSPPLRRHLHIARLVRAEQSRPES